MNQANTLIQYLREHWLALSSLGFVVASVGALLVWAGRRYDLGWLAGIGGLVVGAGVCCVAAACTVGAPGPRGAL